MLKSWNTIIVGGGSAGIAAAEEFAEAGGDETILLITAEDRYPYKRTKISKNIARAFDRNEFISKTAEWYRESGIDVATHTRVREIDISKKRIVTETGERFGFDNVVLAPGADPRRPINPDDAHVIRTIADVEILQSSVSAGERVLVVGVGVLGVEVSEQLSRMGLEIIAVGAGNRIMSEELNEHASEIMTMHFKKHGIDLQLEVRVDSVRRKKNGRFTVDLGDGSRTVDHIVLCAGIDPSVDLAVRSGIAAGRGILVDEMLRTSAEGIYAAGDAAEHPNGSITHLWHAAEYQGRIAVWNILGKKVRHSCPDFRLKCEVFDRYFFSLNKPAPWDIRKYRSVEDKGEVYRCFYYKEDTLRGVVMIDDRERAKTYERAVREGWSRSVVESELPAATSR